MPDIEIIYTTASDKTYTQVTDENGYFVFATKTQPKSNYPLQALSNEYASISMPWPQSNPPETITMLSLADAVLLTGRCHGLNDQDAALIQSEVATVRSVNGMYTLAVRESDLPVDLSVSAEGYNTVEMKDVAQGVDIYMEKHTETEKAMPKLNHQEQDSKPVLQKPEKRSKVQQKVKVDQLDDQKGITVAVNRQMPLMGEPNSDMPGYMLEIIKVIFESQGYRIYIKTLPWHYALNSVIKGSFDAIPGVTKRDRSKGLIFSGEAIGLLNEQFFVSSHSKWRYQGVSSLKSIILGTVKGYSYGPELNPYLSDSQNSHHILQAKIPGCHRKRRSIKKTFGMILCNLKLMVELKRTRDLKRH